jgi:hypothetical protein
MAERERERETRKTKRLRKAIRQTGLNTYGMSKIIYMSFLTATKHSKEKQTSRRPRKGMNINSALRTEVPAVLETLTYAS